MTGRWITIALASLFALLFAAAFVGMAWIRASQGHGGQVYPSEISGLAIREPPADPLADARSRGRGVYQHYCQICHGEEGKGNGFNAGNLQPAPRDFTDGKFWQQSSGERIDYAVAQGGPSVGKSVLMPRWGHTLNERQLRDVIVFIRAFAAPPKAQGK